MSEGPINSAQRWLTPDELKAGMDQQVVWDANEGGGAEVTLMWGKVSGEFIVIRWRGGIKELHRSRHDNIAEARVEFDRQVVAMIADKAVEILTNA